MANRFLSKLFGSGEAFETFLTTLDTFRKNVLSGAITVPKATSATKATQDGNGKNIASTYAKIDDLKNGNLAVPSVNKAALAAKAESIVTTNGSIIKIFVGTQAEYDALTENEQANVFAIITDDASKAEIELSMQALRLNLTELKTGLSNGSVVVAKATQATSATTAESAASAASATKATLDGSGNNIEDTYAKISDLTIGEIEVARASDARKATNATFLASQSVATTLTWSGESASANVNLDADATYLITTTDGAGGYLSFVLTVVKNKITQSSCTGYNRHVIVSYSHSTKKMYLRQYCFMADGINNVGYINIGGGTQTITYAKIANFA